MLLLAVPLMMLYCVCYGVACFFRHVVFGIPFDKDVAKKNNPEQYRKWEEEDRRASEQYRKEEKEHNDWGFIDYSKKD